jgi:UDP:flavonoid glycosyltransferase YjiC (YdhE family)
LSEFLKKGEPPIVFTLGASAVLDAGDFFEQSILAAQKLRSRAVLLVGPQARRKKWNSLPPTMVVADYAPYSELLPHAAATVHQGGVGTTAQALRAGRPTLIVPYIQDQPDNAERVARLGVARVLYRKLYTAEQAVAELTRLLSDNSYSARAADVAQEIRTEDGVAAACDALEEFAAAA